MIRTAPREFRQRFPFDALVFDEIAPQPLYRQLENQIRAAIWEARLRPGEQLPSSRQLARDLGIARNTAKNAYSQQVAEGYLVTSAECECFTPSVNVRS